VAPDLQTLGVAVGAAVRGAAVKGRTVMAKCDVCGNTKTFTVTRGGRTQTFDSFECAIHALAPACAHCGCRVVGHGIEQGDSVYCCAHCARGAGVKGVADRA